MSSGYPREAFVSASQNSLGKGSVRGEQRRRQVRVAGPGEISQLLLLLMLVLLMLVLPVVLPISCLQAC